MADKKPGQELTTQPHTTEHTITVAGRSSQPGRSPAESVPPASLVSDRTRYLELSEPFVLGSGKTLPGVRVAYRTWGQPAEEAVLVCHALTGSADADVWWDGLLGAGRALDPTTEYVVSVNTLGSCYGTTGPTDTPPGSSRPYGPEFPPISIEDTVRLQAEVLDHLGVKRVSMVIGGSMGGMQALQWGVTFPHRVDSLVPIGTGAAQSGWAVAISDAQRSAIHTDPNFQDGRYSSVRPPSAGLATARMMAMISYRSFHEFEDRFGRSKTGAVYDAQQYLRRHGEKLVERFDANTYLTLIDAMDTFDLSDRVGSITTPALVVGISSDILYPVVEVQRLATDMPNAQFGLLSADQGHDSFLIETDQLDQAVRRFRKKLSEGWYPAVERNHGQSGHRAAHDRKERDRW